MRLLLLPLAVILAAYLLRRREQRRHRELVETLKALLPPEPFLDWARRRRAERLTGLDELRREGSL